MVFSPTNMAIQKWYLLGGFNPSEKYESQLGLLFPIYGKIKHVPNHQPDMIYWFYTLDTNYLMALSRVAPSKPKEDQWISEDKKKSPPIGMIEWLIIMRVTQYTLRNLVWREVDISKKKLE